MRVSSEALFYGSIPVSSLYSENNCVYLTEHYYLSYSVTAMHNMEVMHNFHYQNTYSFQSTSGGSLQ
ncbi:hypothetical protein NCCP2331_32560 [Sporosarcina sp. NCCP-2331]|nr:hypothetical protein NCCP2331_32560 [Sporosarcina sp. NCCP-2331]GLB57422.1 hypothetical protein NCCP2378_32100 [Sporosarcina sp. NCCP-2378]